MRCERCRRLVSLRMDGEHLSSHQLQAMERHLASCPDCRAFEERAHRLRAAVRIRPAEPVPELVGRVMAAVAREARGRPAGVAREGIGHPGAREAEVRPAPAREGVPVAGEELGRPAAARPLRPRRPLLPRLAGNLAPVAAALVVGIIVGSLVVGGPWPRREAAPIAAAEVREGVLRAAARVRALRATFLVTERNLHFPAVTQRRLILSVAFRAPERFRLEVDDLTDYPGNRWTPTDLTLVVNGARWSLTAPSACPRGLGRTCPPVRTVVRDRAPFSPGTPMPTDLVVPLEIFAGGEPELLGEGRVLGRPAVRVAVPYAAARSLFAFTELGGTWRPFFEDDRVVLWLDRRTWLPLEWQVFPARGRERNLWEQRFELPPEHPSRAVFEVRAVNVSRERPRPGTFRIEAGPGNVRTEGVRRVPVASLAEEIGYEPVAPDAVDGLPLYQAVVPAGPAPATPDAVVTYARGLSWVKLAERRGETGSAPGSGPGEEGEPPFGPVSPLAEEIALPGGGVAYYEPATEEAGRRLLIHAEGTDLLLETNLPREELFRIAANLPVLGLPAPRSWFRGDGEGLRVSLEEAAARAGFVPLVPATLPEGFVLASVELLPGGEGPSGVELVPGEDGASGVVLHIRPEDSVASGAWIRVFQQPAEELPPATAADVREVGVRGTAGRWSPERSQLEWLEAGLYLSVDAPGASLDDLLAVAASLEPLAASPGASAAPTPGEASAATPSRSVPTPPGSPAGAAAGGA